MPENSHNSIKSFSSELIKKYSDPRFKNEKGQSIIFKDYTWNLNDLESLTKNGFNINSIDNFGKTPIFYCKDKIQFRLLLMYGADFHHVDNEGKNLLFYDNEIENVELMLKFEINTTIKDSKNRSFLSHELFHTIPFVFSRHLASTKIRDLEIFQAFDNTYNCLKLINEYGIKVFLPNKIHLHFDPLSNPLPFEKFRSALKKVDFHQDTKFTFYTDENKICNLYTLKNLEKALSKG